ncbi:MAG TPA: ATP-binding protein [Vicinamibacteria bacterium]|nr:ATP-binding protein [Vicinamibacteria bacterium]
MGKERAGRVLLIDVDAGTAEGLRTNPLLAGCAFEAVCGEAAALRRLRRAAFDVAVTSPVATIEEDLPLVEEIARVRPAVRTIVLAPVATPEGLIAALRARVFACFAAPFDIHEIAPMMRRAIDEVDWRNGIQVLSAHRNWLAVRMDCRMLNADRLVSFLNELPSDRPEEERDRLMVAFREILLNAMEHGGNFDPDKVVEVTAIRTERAIVFYVHDPGPGFLQNDLAHAAVSNPPGEPFAHAGRRAEMGLRPGGFGLLLAQRIVDELIYNEAGNEVLMIKHTS